MPLVLVHGNPESAAIWDGLRAHLERDDVVALSPPGFGAPAPEDFGATSDDYVRWLAAELRRMDGPVDVVGHDWGGGHVIRLACAFPELVRSWASDIAGCFHPAYVWHDMAQTWQQDGVGESAIERMLHTPEWERAAGFTSLGIDSRTAQAMAAAANADMGRCILALYRSAAQPAIAGWGNALPAAAARPGLAIIPTEDPYTGGEQLAREAAARAGAEIALLAGRGHWWMCEDPEGGARVLNDFLRSLV